MAIPCYDYLFERIKKLDSSLANNVKNLFLCIQTKPKEHSIINKRKITWNLQ